MVIGTEMNRLLILPMILLPGCALFTPGPDGVAPVEAGVQEAARVFTETADGDYSPEALVGAGVAAAIAAGFAIYRKVKKNKNAVPTKKV